MNITMPKYCFKINGLPKDTEFNSMPLGRQMDHHAAIAAFKARAKRGHIGAKRRSTAAGFRDFKALYQTVEWFFINRDNGSLYHDDSTEIWYTTEDKA